MEFAKLNAPTLKELFIGEMETMILSGKLQTGQKLPSERELAEQMQVSRTVVNSGIADLERKGFLAVKPRSGVYVADYRRTGTPETIRSIMNYNGGHLRPEEIRSILEIKRMFDQLVVAQAIPALTEEGVATLRELLEQLRKESLPTRSSEIAFDFYHELSLLATNTLIPLIYQAFRVPNLSLWESYAQKYGCESVYNNAKKLLDTIIAHDTEAAQAHIRNSLDDLIDGGQPIYNV